VERGSWTPAPVFNLIASRGRVERAEMEKTFNMGIGMIAVLPADDVDRALAMLTARHVEAWVLGEVRRTVGPAAAQPGSRVLLRGEHPRF
jgi:phosphoribosylformylglycinamidine cyclo-ligase